MSAKPGCHTPCSLYSFVRYCIFGVHSIRSRIFHLPPPPTHWSHVFQSCIFHSCSMVPCFPVSRFPPLHFWRCRVFRSRNSVAPYGDRAFLVAVVRIWNSLPQHSISHLLRHFPSSALAWRHTCSNSVTCNYCSVVVHTREVTLSFMDMLIALTYLLTSYFVIYISAEW